VEEDRAGAVRRAVQSAAVRLLVLREQERRNFKSAAYWDRKATLEAHGQQFVAYLVALGGVRLATGKDFDESRRIPAGKDVLLLNEEQARALVKRLKDGQWQVRDVNERDQTRTPAPPFTTSTLQQEANRKLGLSSRQTMQIAQRLYEQGLITYMRTDSVHLSNQALQTIRQRVRDLYGADYLSPAPRQYQTQSKGAQEAHEAIRPAGQQMPTADELGLKGQEYALYDLIWKRAMASQMADARLRLTTVTIQVDDASSARRADACCFPAFSALCGGADDPNAALDDQETILPPLKVGELVKCRKLEPPATKPSPLPGTRMLRWSRRSKVRALAAPAPMPRSSALIQERGYVVSGQAASSRPLPRLPSTA
jgi:DNA topoisomerase-1